MSPICRHPATSASIRRMPDTRRRQDNRNQPAAGRVLHTPHQRKTAIRDVFVLTDDYRLFRASANPCPGHTLVHPLQPQRARIRQQRFHADRQRAETKTNGTFPLLDTATDERFRIHRKYHHRAQPVPTKEVLSGDQSGGLSAQGFPTGIRSSPFRDVGEWPRNFYKET